MASRGAKRAGGAVALTAATGSGSEHGFPGEPPDPGDEEGGLAAPAGIARPRLTDRLLLSPPASLVVLTAPAGYSKTTTIRGWQATDRRPFVWVMCDRRHDDPAFLITAIAAAASRLTPIDEEAVAALAVEAARPEKALARLASLLEDLDSGFALVIDDAHLLRSEGSVALLRGLPDALPRNAQLVVGSRVAIPINLGRMRANRNLLELGIRDLAMTGRESRRMLSAAGLELDDHQVDLIHERTEGWPAALYLASLALAGSSDTNLAVKEFAGDDRAVAEYLQDEFLAITDSGTLEFMTRTSVLETLDGPLCDAVLDRSDSSLKLRSLARSNALMIPLDRKDLTFRYHHLLADMLQAELRRTEPRIEASLHSRASLWLEENSRPEQAVEHAIASGDVCLAGRLIWGLVPELTGRGRLATLNRWLDEVGRDRLSECHDLLFTAAHVNLLAGAGDESAYWTELASELVVRDGCAATAERDLLMLRATRATEGLAAMSASSSGVLKLMAADDVWHGAASLYLGVSTHLLGDPATAVAELRDAVRVTAVASPVIQSLARAQLALIESGYEDRGDAIRLISEARSQVDRCGLAEFPALVLVYAIETLIMSLEGRNERAMEGLTTSRRLLAEMNSFPPWYEAEARLALADACHRMGDLETARSLLAETRVHLALVDDAIVLNDWLASLEAELAIESNESPMPHDSKLTKAELRTLSFLPTHLSFRQIGEANGVSANTVKTQARSVYRKLAVSSRAEAVEEARRSGLLEVPQVTDAAGTENSGKQAPD